MRKRIVFIGIFIGIVFLTTIGTKTITHYKMSACGMIFSNIEALAADSEGGGKGRDCSFGKEFTGKTYNVAYECIDHGRTLCIQWEQYRQTGAAAGYCTNYN